MPAHDEIDRNNLPPVLREVLDRAERLGIELGPAWPDDVTDDEFLEHLRRNSKAPDPAP